MQRQRIDTFNFKEIGLRKCRTFLKHIEEADSNYCLNTK